MTRKIFPMCEVVQLNIGRTFQTTSKLGHEVVNVYDFKYIVLTVATVHKGTFVQSKPEQYCLLLSDLKS
jgi:hypothetical protein